jgi:DNA-binding NarL/FixJ family response regulator
MEVNYVLPESAVQSCDVERQFSVVIISEVRPLGEGLAQDLARNALVSHCAFCGSLEEALPQIRHLQADIALLDAALGNGSSSIARIRSAAPCARVVALGVAETPENIIVWAEAGAAGYIRNTAALCEVVPLLVDVMSGVQTCSGSVASGLLRRLFDVAQSGAFREDRPAASMLTGREMQILELISIGLSNKEIARHLNIGLGTTKSHVHNLLAKLSLKRRSQAALWMRERQVRVGVLPSVLSSRFSGARI